MLIVDVFCRFSFGNWYFFIILHQNDTKKKMKLAPLFFTFFNSAFALQMEPPPPPNQPPPPPGLPIDGWVFFLLVAGLAYGAWKYYSLHKLKQAS